MYLFRKSKSKKKPTHRIQPKKFFGGGVLTRKQRNNQTDAPIMIEKIQKEYNFFNKAIRDYEIFHIGHLEGLALSPYLTSDEVQGELMYGKSFRIIQLGILPPIKTTKIDLIAEAIRKFSLGKSQHTLTLVDLHAITNSRHADDIIYAIADVLPLTSILCLNLGELEISVDALKYLLDKVKHDNTLLGSIFIEDIDKDLKQQFRIALMENRKKTRFLKAIANPRRYKVLENYRSSWWNLSVISADIWTSRLKKRMHDEGHMDHLEPQPDNQEDLDPLPDPHLDPLPDPHLDPLPDPHYDDYDPYEDPHLDFYDQDFYNQDFYDQDEDDPEEDDPEEDDPEEDDPEEDDPEEDDPEEDDPDEDRTRKKNKKWHDF
jgi:hypothetical protein